MLSPVGMNQQPQNKKVNFGRAIVTPKKKVKDISTLARYIKNTYGSTETKVLENGKIEIKSVLKKDYTVGDGNNGTIDVKTLTKNQANKSYSNILFENDIVDVLKKWGLVKKFGKNGAKKDVDGEGKLIEKHFKKDIKNFKKQRTQVFYEA